MFLTPITEHKLFAEINKLSQNKAPGIDNIPSGIIKLTTDFITTPLTHIFNTSFDSATVPDSLKTAKVIPVYKTNKKHSPGNYRPISLLSIFNKLLEKLMYKRLFAFLNQFNILEKYQFGFRRGYSTTMAVTEIIENIRNEIDKGNSVLSVYLDLSKAFDMVDHNILLEKLEYYGIRGHVKKWFCSYLNNRKLKTYVNSKLSNSENINIGVPQGSVLGPLLFLLYVNDIPSCVKEGSIRLFADDTNVFFSHKSINILKEIAERDMVNLHNWFIANRLLLSLNKHVSVYIATKTLKDYKRL